MFQPFDKLLPQIRGGKAVDEITEAIQRTAVAVNDTGKPGSVTLVLKFTRQEEDQLHVEMDLKEKVPVSRGATLFFVDPNGNLMLDNPRQMTIPGFARDEFEAPYRKEISA